MEKQKYQKIIETIQEIVGEVEMKVTDADILENATKIYNTEIINTQKQTKSPYKEEPATEKQVKLIKRLNKDIVPAGITKKEASILIDELNNRK